ncbi:MAG: rod shape-determining protein [Clostridia bacterium]|nr:rod shape-determining protein [Clostridia bacterium]
MAKLIGVDLGTSNTFMYMKPQGIALRSPSVVAIDKQSRDVVSFGVEARRMLGKTPAGIVAFKPLVGGVIADYDVTAKMLRIFFETTNSISLFSRPSVIVCIPHGITEVEKRAVEDATLEAGAKTVALIETPIAAAIGTGIRIGGARGNMIVDIGGGTTEVAVISLGGISASKSLRLAGDDLDQAIIRYLRLRKNIFIGEITAEELKIKIGSAHPDTDGGSMIVYGRNVNSSHAATEEISSADIRLAMKAELEQIVRAIKATLEETPPELSADIYEQGITLTGGGSNLRGIDKLISERTGIKVNRVKNPLESVCLGIGRVIESEGALANLLRYRGR